MFRIGMSELVVLAIVCLCVGVSLGLAGSGLLVRSSRSAKKDGKK